MILSLPQKVRFWLREKEEFYANMYIPVVEIFTAYIQMVTWIIVCIVRTKRNLTGNGEML